MTLWDSVASAIAEATQRPFHLHRQTPVSGGDINQCYRIDGADGRSYFLKRNDARHALMFAAEAAGLAAIAATGTLRVPHVICHGRAAGYSYLVLEHLALHGRTDEGRLGAQLAALHRCTSKRFGFMQDNYLGTTQQPNAWTSDWSAFWGEHRLGFQLQLAERNGLDSALQQLGKRLLQLLPAFFADYTPQPSLLHGDLWGGNHSYLTDGTPIIYDPAAYYGDRECDLAMTELFGGYGPAFYAAYRAAWPLDKGYVARRELYNLYHILNHANLFGGSYVQRAQRMMRALLTAP